MAGHAWKNKGGIFWEQQLQKALHWELKTLKCWNKKANISCSFSSRPVITSFFLLHLVSEGYVRVQHTTTHLHLRKCKSLNVQENADTPRSPKLYWWKHTGSPLKKYLILKGFLISATIIFFLISAFVLFVFSFPPKPSAKQG